jgi:hypothetical protein
MTFPPILISFSRRLVSDQRFTAFGIASWISGPIVFVGVGILGPDGLGVFRLNITGEGLRLLAELTLAIFVSAMPPTRISASCV